MSDELPPSGAPPNDPENLRRLREQAQRRLDREDDQPVYPAPAYGSPPSPAPVYGSPPPGGSKLKRTLLIALGAIAVVLVGLFAYVKLGGRLPFGPPPVAMYGGPPLPPPHPPVPMYGGPPPPGPTPVPHPPGAFILNLPGIGWLFRKLRLWR